MGAFSEEKDEWRERKEWMRERAKGGRVEEGDERKRESTKGGKKWRKEGEGKEGKGNYNSYDTV